MADCCLLAKPVGIAVLKGHRMIFRGHASFERHDTHNVHGALWRITDQCEEALDRHRVYPGLYVKKVVTITAVDGKDVEALMYHLNPDLPMQVPDRQYFDTIVAGYRDFKLPEEQLTNAWNEVVEMGFRDVDEALIGLGLPIFYPEELVESQKPRKYKVLFLNDDATPFDWVVAVLQIYFGKTEHAATEIAQAVHGQGRAVAGVYSRDVAETKVTTVARIARDHGWPFVAEVQPE